MPYGRVLVANFVKLEVDGSAPRIQNWGCRKAQSEGYGSVLERTGLTPFVWQSQNRSAESCNCTVKSQAWFVAIRMHDV